MAQFSHSNSVYWTVTYKASAVFRFLTNLRAITRFSLAIGGSPYLRRDTNLRLAPSSYYGSLGATTPLVGDTLTLPSRQLLSPVKSSPSELASTRLLLRAVPQRNSVDETLLSGRTFPPIRRCLGLSHLFAASLSFLFYLFCYHVLCIVGKLKEPTKISLFLPCGSKHFFIFKFRHTLSYQISIRKGNFKEITQDLCLKIMEITNIGQNRMDSTEHLIGIYLYIFRGALRVAGGSCPKPENSLRKMMLFSRTR